MIIMRVQYAALLGFLIGVFNLIPFFGAIVAVIIAIFITFCTAGLGKAIWLAIVIVTLQQIDANIINPKILGDKLKIKSDYAAAFIGIIVVYILKVIPVVGSFVSTIAILAGLGIIYDYVTTKKI